MCVSFQLEVYLLVVDLRIRKMFHMLDLAFLFAVFTSFLFFKYRCLTGWDEKTVLTDTLAILVNAVIAGPISVLSDGVF
jgi:hypothetical protein